MSSWEKLVKEQLITSQFIDGVAVITHRGELAYSYGNMSQVVENSWRQFQGAFMYSNPKHDEMICTKGFSLTFTDDRTLPFKAYQKTYNSIYCVSPGNEIGLIVGNLPYGVLLCSYDGLCQAPGDIVKHVESFCDVLRS